MSSSKLWCVYVHVFIIVHLKLLHHTHSNTRPHSHTQGHMCYLCSTPSTPSTIPTPPVVFTGDCLFVGGCGRNMGGDYAQMFNSLDVLARLPPETLVYCGHEYAQRNLEFLSSIGAWSVWVVDNMFCM